MFLKGFIIFFVLSTFNVSLLGFRQKQWRLHRRARTSADDEGTRSDADVRWRHSDVYWSRLQRPTAHHLRRFLILIWYFSMVFWQCWWNVRNEIILKVWALINQETNYLPYLGFDSRPTLITVSAGLRSLRVIGTPAFSTVPAESS